MQISVVMPAYNAEKYIAEAIDSVLAQSFTDFEFIIVDDGSTDDTLSIIKSYIDSRIVLIENEHNFIESLNKGMQAARGNYIARMDADDIMHVDRLKVQFSIMEEEPDITVCGTQMIFFGEKMKPGISKNPTGLIESPLVVFLKGNPVSHPTVLIRRDFLRTHQLQYEVYPYAEDFKLWTEIAKKGGVFYLESQPLLNYRVSDSQVSNQKRQKQQETTYFIKEEIIDHFIKQSAIEQSALKALRINLQELKSLDLVDSERISQIFHSLFTKKKTLIRAK